MNSSSHKLSRVEAGRLGYLKTKEKREAKYAAARSEYASSPKVCICCAVQLTFEKRGFKFCSQSCAAKHNNKGINRHKNSTRNKCKTCDNYAKKLFCSQQCCTDFKWNLRKAKITADGVFEQVRAQNYTKRYLVETKGPGCEICKTEVWCNAPVPLILDHIDGDSTNNKISNIRLVCGNCDMQLPTYKNKNKGKGRASRRERYRLNKTY